VKLVIGERIREPDFATRMRAEGMVLPDLQIAEAVTLDRVIVASQPLSRPTLLHELIHVVQYSLLGVDRFAQRYLQEYLTCGYDTMPLELMAADLTRRIEAGDIFDVTDSVKDQL
jgi:hypothetical protein